MEKNSVRRRQPALIDRALLVCLLGVCLLGAALFVAACAHAPRAAHNAESQAPPERVDRRFTWPVHGGVLSSPFGMRNGVMHDGVDIAAPAGTPVHAAGKGVVIFSGRLRGYGNVVIVRHDDHYVTVYAHTRTNAVREGDTVARDQIIAQVGTTGHTTGPNLHFEVRRDNFARNPLNYLPVIPAVSGQSFARGDAS